jgi:lipocalin
VKIAILLLAAALLIPGAVAVAAASDRTDRMPVAVFDLRRYMGTWYEIARYDHSFERGLAGVQARYELRPDGRIGVFNSGTDYRSGRCKRARGKACAGQVPGRLRVSFFWVFYSDYNVMELGGDYDWALVGGGSAILKSMQFLERQIH